ncbi:MAG: hypothetical protein AAGD43_02515 [Pseudomonadota bacterium]
MKDKVVQKAQHVAANPDQYMDDPGLIETAFLALLKARGKTVRYENLGPTRYRFNSTLLAPSLVKQIRAQRPPLICPGAAI